jgi:phytoene dehydrogenase-like protein
MKNYDAIIVGAGHNGLTTAAFLAKAGLNVVCVEKNDYIGGATVSRNLYKDWWYSNCSYVQVTPYGGSVTFMENGDYFGSYHDAEVAYREMARFSRHDADAYKTYSADTMRQCRFIRDFLLSTAPDPTSFKPRDIKELARIGSKFMDMGEDRMYETIRFWTMSVAEYLDEYFETDVIKAALSGSGIIGTALGMGFARGGTGAVSKAIAGSLQAAGGEIRTEAGVDKIIVRNGKAVGVALDNGDELNADIVVSAMDVKRTFLTCMDKSDLPEKFHRRVENFKIRGSSGKINIALDGLPTFTALPKGSSLIHSDMHFIDSMDRMELAYDDWKDGTWSKDPYIDMTIPTLSDPTMAPPGKHFMSCFVQYCPHKIEGRDWTSEEKDGFAKSVFDQIANYSPDFKDLILHAEVRTPQDIEDEIGITEGNIFHGELTMDQLLFNRPIPGYAQYRSPVPGLYMCGSSNHPGGGIMAAPGANAAREILSDLKRPNVVPENFGDD